ncbi:hypothetical protein [Verrucosispora sp. NA02020]|uniref:hypothetical protein n=2 Tax=Micromonospora TaxID=1873 RepID=UPI0020CA988E|nr:hypothetical protein [Verrucosispora sp. NA02020]
MMSMRRWLAGAGVVALVVSTGACGDATPDAAATPEATGTPAASATSAAPTPTEASPSPTSANPPVLSGDRQVTITRVDAVESGLSLTDERLAEVDGDEGRQLFVATPVEGQTFLIKSYRGAGGGPGTGEPVCWQVQNPGNSQPLVVQGAECQESEQRQLFTIAPNPENAETYLISNNSAYLRNTRNNGLIMEELGDAAPFDSFRFNDNGAAPSS